MRKWIALIAVAGLVAVGCAKEKTEEKTAGMDSRRMTIDACPHCSGIQAATADGKCPDCGMNVAMPDACPNCSGIQTADADGKCPGCGQLIAR